MQSVAAPQPLPTRTVRLTRTHQEFVGLGPDKLLVSMPPFSPFSHERFCIRRLSGRGPTDASGIELYFPPFRAPAAALTLALFGVTCLVPGVLAAVAVLPASGADSAGMVALWLMGIFILPFVAFGVVFIAVAAYLLANSLRVEVTGSGIVSARSVFGLPLAQRRVARADIAALDAVALRYRGLFREDAHYGLVVKTKSGTGLTLREAWRTGRLEQYRNRAVTVAEGLRGEALVERVRSEIIKAGRLTL